MNEEQKDYAVGKALSELINIIMTVDAEIKAKNKQSDEDVSL